MDRIGIFIFTLGLISILRYSSAVFVSCVLHFLLFSSSAFIAFSALTLLVGHQEEHPAYKKFE